MPDSLPRRTRLGAYAIVIRDDEILLARLAEYLVDGELWGLPGGGVDFGEDPRDAVVREVYEETGLRVTVGDRAWTDTARFHATIDDVDMHAVRLVYDGWVAADSPEPQVMEIDGSTIDARWHPLGDVLDGTVPLVRWVARALAAHRPARLQRIAAYGVAIRDEQILLTRISGNGHRPGMWTLPGGGVDHGERPADAVVRELREETGLEAEVEELLGVHDVHFTGTAPGGRTEDFHGVHVLFRVAVPEDAPQVLELDGTTDAAAWVPLAEVESGAVPVFDVVRYAIEREAGS